MFTAIKTLHETVEKYDNLYDNDYERAVKQIVDELPAYYATVKYHDAMTWGIIAEAVNAGLDYALDNVPYFKRDQIPAFLERIVPLNREAIAELNKIKEAYSGE